jgi:hypothetical protein
MRQTAIDEIAIDQAGRLLVRPRLGPAHDFAFIYRDASGVRWDAGSRSLVAPAPETWSYLDWLKQIVAAVSSEYGHRLQLTPETRWSGVPAELQSSIEQWLQEGG